MEMRCETRRVSPLHNVPPHRTHLERSGNSAGVRWLYAALVVLAVLVAIAGRDGQRQAGADRNDRDDGHADRDDLDDGYRTAEPGRA